MRKYYINAYNEIWCATDEKNYVKEAGVFNFGDLANLRDETGWLYDNLAEAIQKQKEISLFNFQKAHIQMCSMSLILTMQVLSEYADKLPEVTKNDYIDMLVDLMNAQYNYLEQQPFTFNPKSAQTLKTIKDTMHTGHWDSFMKTIEHYRIFEKDAPTIKLVDSIKELNETETTV